MTFKFDSLPCAPLRITSKFGKRNTGIAGASTYHQGVDLGRDFTKSKTEITSVKGGIVTSNYWNDYRGWVITIKHDDTYTTLYQHLAKRSSFPVGSKVVAGEAIGIMGNSSNKAVLKIATHLHFELREKGVPIDPEKYLKEVKPVDENRVRQIIKEELQNASVTEPSKVLKPTWDEAKTKGITDGSRPQGYATREQVIAMVIRAVKAFIEK